jgi:hypothetical protein
MPAQDLATVTAPASAGIAVPDFYGAVVGNLPSFRSAGMRVGSFADEPWSNLCGEDLHVGACRRDHQVKQHPRWKLAQVRPGWFQWTAPSGRTYIAGPETYAA